MGLESCSGVVVDVFVNITVLALQTNSNGEADVQEQKSYIKNNESSTTLLCND